MPTTRKRRNRGKATKYPAELHMVFHIGSGMNSYDEAWLEQQWHQYGQAFMDQNPDRNCFALTVYGEPNQKASNQKESKT